MLRTKDCPMTKMVPLLFLCLLTQGCVGIGALRTRTEAYPIPYMSGTNSPADTSNWLEDHWGKPNKISHAGAGSLDEIWTYKFGLRWDGVLLAVVVPIPIAVPVGREQVCFVIRGGRVIGAERRRTQSVGRGFGFYAGMGGPSFGVFSMNN
jgi:hypothetical protein